MTNAKKNYIAHTYIFRNGALRHSEKEFGTAVAAFKYLYKKIKRYAGTTDVTHTVETPNGKELYRNRLGYDVRFADSEIEKLYDEYEGITDTAEAEENYINDYAVSVEAQEIAISAEMELADPNREPDLVIIGQNGAKYRFYREVKIATAEYFTDGDTINAFPSIMYDMDCGRIVEARIQVPYIWYETLTPLASGTFGDYVIGAYNNLSYDEVSKVIAELKHAIMRGDKTFKMPEDKPAEVEETSDNANEITTEKNYIEQLGTQKIHHAENLVAALENFDEKIESGAGIKSLENAARNIDRCVKQIEEINRNIAAHEKRIADLENEETSDVAKFEVGKMYQAYHLYFDTPHKWNFKVVKRTATHITVCDDFDDEGEKETFRCKVCFDEHYGGEYVESKTEYDSIGCRIRADREYIPGEKEKVA